MVPIKYFRSAVIVSVIIILAGAYLCARSGNVYRSEMVCQFNALTRKAYGEMIHKLDILARTNSYATLARELNIRENDAECIVSIEGENKAGTPLYEDDVADDAPMYLIVTATNNQVFAPLQKALLDYLNHASPYHNTKIALESNMIEKRMQFIKQDLTIIDSIISTARKINIAKDTFTVSNIIALLNYSNSLEEKQLLQQTRMKEIQESVQVLNGFLPPEHPSNNRIHIILLTVLCSAGAFVFIMVLGFVVSGIKFV
jgi:hypothetical protein